MCLQFGDPGFALPRQHALLFRRVVLFLSDMVGWEAREDTDWQTGVAVFDELSQGQKQVILYDVAGGMLDDSSEPGKVHSSLMGALAVVYKTMWEMIDGEIAWNNRCTTVRTLVLAALAETDYWMVINDLVPCHEEPERPPAANCFDLGIWKELVEALQVTVVEDIDDEMGQWIMDLDPHQSAAVKRLLNITPHYFTTIVEDPSTERLCVIRHSLNFLVGREG